MIKRPNIVWLLVDSIRTYKTDEDVRGKLPIMERFEQVAVSFKTCVTTAPSTIMSITAMMTGLPAYFVARNYDDFRFDDRYYYSLARVLKERGYSSYSFLRGPETREKFKTLLDPVPRRYWGGHLRHRFKWTNEDLNLVLGHVLQRDVPRPAFLFFHYNPEARSASGNLIIDPAVSHRVEEALDLLHQADFTPDNTIYVLCSDHGFPDPSKGMTSDWAARHRMTHDLVLTDDNILIPLYIQYPGCRPRSIDVPVSSLDLFPTLLDLTGIGVSEEVRDSIDGHSLVPLIRSEVEVEHPRKCFRCDARLMLQSARATAIRGVRYKYIRFHDRYGFASAELGSSDGEVLIDLQEDVDETRNLLVTTKADVYDIAKRFRAEFEASERRGVEFQIRYLVSRQTQLLDDRASPLSLGSAARVLLAFEPDTSAYAEIGIQAIDRLFPGTRIDVLGSEDVSRSMGSGNIETMHHYQSRADGSITAPTSLIARRTREEGKYELSILFVQRPSAPIVRDLLRILNRVPADQHLVVDCNFTVYERQHYWYYRWRALRERFPYMIQEPQLLFSQLATAAKLVAKNLLRRLGRWERWEAADPQARRRVEK